MISNKHQRFIDLLTKVAESVPPVRTARIAAGLVYKNELISVGTNQYKSHPFQSKYGKNSCAIYLHAEVDCIKNALRTNSMDDISRSTMYIVRRKFKDQYRKHFENGLACPCDGCRRAIAAFDISNVVFTSNGEEFYEL